MLQQCRRLNAPLKVSIFCNTSYNIGVPYPPSRRLTVNDVFESRGKPNIEKLKQHFLLEGRVTDEAALKIINDGAALLREEANVLEIDAPVTG